MIWNRHSYILRKSERNILTIIPEIYRSNKESSSLQGDLSVHEYYNERKVLLKYKLQWEKSTAWVQTTMRGLHQGLSVLYISFVLW